MNKEIIETKRTVVVTVCFAVALLAVSACFASEGGGGAHHVDKGAQAMDFVWRIVNFSMLAGLIWFALKKANVKGSLEGRQLQIEKDLKEAQDGRAAAEAKLAEYTVKLDQASKEIDDMYAAIVREGEQEKNRIVAEAKIAAEKIVAQAALSAEQETLKARNELRAEAARLAVEIAAGKLGGAVQKADHDRFVGEYLDKVVQIQ